MTSPFRRIAVALSGGVDSAVTLALLKRYKRKFDLTAVYMSNWDPLDDDMVSPCRQSGASDLEFCHRVCSALDVPLRVVSFVKEYWTDVFSPMIVDYEAGLTPNPDVLCNRFVKFGRLFEWVERELGAEGVATGHYARTSFGSYGELWEEGKSVRLFRALDPTKDQTLFLAAVPQASLRRSLFPLGSLYKSQVRRLAREYGLPFIATKKDSTGICFVGNRSFPDFISRYVEDARGQFVDVDDGKVLGEHSGVHRFTLGQRCRLSGSLDPLYVAARDPLTQTVFAARGHNHPTLFSTVMWTEEPHWISPDPPDTESSLSPSTLMFKFQHKEWTVPAQIQRVDGNAHNYRTEQLLFPRNLENFPPKLFRVWLSIPTRAVTPGQTAVFYRDQECLGSAKIIWTDALDYIMEGVRLSGNNNNVFRSSVEEQGIVLQTKC